VLAPGAATASAAPTAIQKIDHVIVLMQENRSFDSYIGAYPGAAVAMSNGVPRCPCFGDCVNG
jgi:phospholipase C